MNKYEKAPRSFEVIIEKLVYGGSGFGRHQGKVVFVPFSVPGDRLLVRPVEDKKTFTRAEIIRILKPGKGRVAPVCPYFANCGGCHWQQLEYSGQIEAKRRILEEIFHHRFPQTRELPITMRGCAHPFGYRSRARVQLRGAGSKASVGFFRTRSHSVQDIENCPLFRPSLNEALSSIRQFKHRIDPDSNPQEMDMACSQEEDLWAVARVGKEQSDSVPTLSGSGKRDELLLKRKVGEFYYSVSASVFFQANDFMVPDLVSVVRESIEGAGQDSALDLFAGVGLFSLPLARVFRKVTAVENSPAACRLCSANATAAGITNLKAVCADVVTWMKSETSSGVPKPDLIILDPPRTGAGEDVMEQILKQEPEIILYVSCDPQTLVRDLMFSARHYRIDSVEALDMFPQTYHFETVVRLKKN